MTRTFLFTFTILYCYSLSGQAIGPKRFLWTPVVRPLNHLPKTGVNRFDPTKRGQSFTHTARWGRYPEQFKPTPKSIRVGNTDITVNGRGYSKGSPQRSLSGRGYMGARPSIHTHVQEEGIVPRIDLFGTPQTQMVDSTPKFSDFILDYRTDIFTSRTAHGFFTGDLVKFDSLPALSNAALAGNDRDPLANRLNRLEPGMNPANNPLPGLLNEDGYFVADMGQGGGQLAGNRFSNAELNSTVFAVRRLDDYRLSLHPTINSAMDLPRQVSRDLPSNFAGANRAMYGHPGAKPSNFVVAQPVIGPAGNAQIQEFRNAPYTLGDWKDICVSTDSVPSTQIDINANLERLIFDNPHNLVQGQGVFFDGNPPRGAANNVNTGDTYFAIVETPTTIRLEDENGNEINLAGAGVNPATSMLNATGAPSYTLFKTFLVNNGNNSISRANHGLKTGDMVYWNRTRWNTGQNPTSGPGAAFPTPVTPGPTNGGLYPSNEHYYVSVDGRNVWLHINEDNATFNGNVGPGANAINLGFGGALNNTVGNKRFPIYSVIKEVDNPTNPGDIWKWRRTVVEPVVVATTVDIDKFATDAASHPGQTPTIQPVTSTSGATVASFAQNIIRFAAGTCPWRTGDKIRFEPFAMNGELPPPLVATQDYWVFNVGEEAGNYDEIILHENKAAAAPNPAIDLNLQQHKWRIYNNHISSRAPQLTDPAALPAQGTAHTINGINKSTAGVNHNLETGDRVIVTATSVAAPAAPNPPIFGQVPAFQAGANVWVSVRSIDANVAPGAGNAPWIYFHGDYNAAINTQKPNQPGAATNPKGTREAPSMLPIDMWAPTATANDNSHGAVTPNKLRLNGNAQRLRPGDRVVFPAIKGNHDLADPGGANTIPFVAGVAAGQPVFVSVSRGNNNFNTDRFNWGGLRWANMGGPGMGARNRGNDPDQWWLHFHAFEADAEARSLDRDDSIGRSKWIGQGQAQQIVLNFGPNTAGPHHFHRADVADRPGDPSPVWAEAPTGTPVTISTAAGQVAPTGTRYQQTGNLTDNPDNFENSLWYIRRQGPGDGAAAPINGPPGKEISFHPTQRDAEDGTNPAIFSANPGLIFTVTIADRLVVSGQAGNVPFQNGDRVRFIDTDGDGNLVNDVPLVRDNADPFNRGGYVRRPPNLFSQEDPPAAGANSPKYRYFYVSVSDTGQQVSLHETYEDAWTNPPASGFGEGFGEYAIAFQVPVGGAANAPPWTLEWIRPPRITGRSRFHLTGPHNLLNDDVLYFAPGAGGKLPVTWDPDIDIDGDGGADGSWRGMEMNTPYRVMNSQMGQIDRPRGPDWLNWGPAAGVNAGSGPQTGFSGYLSPTSLEEDPDGDGFSNFPAQPFTQRGTTLHIAYSSKEAQIVEDIDSSAQMRITERALGIYSGNEQFDGLVPNHADRPENNFNAYRDTGRVRVRLRTDDSHNTLEQLPGTDPTQIFIGKSPRRSNRSEFRLKFLRHNFYHAGPYINNPSGDASCANYWQEYRYFATYEAIPNKSNRVGLESNATFIVLGTPRGFPVNDLRDIIPVSGLTLAAGDAGVDPGGNAVNAYISPHLQNPWANPTSYANSYGSDLTATQTGGRRWDHIAIDGRWPAEPICWKVVHPQGPIAAAAEGIRHPEDLDMENLIRVQRGPLQITQVGNPPVPGPLGTVNILEDLWGGGNANTGYTPFGADPDIADGNELPNMPFGFNIDAHDVYRNDNTFNGTDAANGTFPLTLGGKITRKGIYDYPREGHRLNPNIAGNEPDSRNVSNGPNGFGTDTLGNWGIDDVGVREYDRNNGYENVQMFGDFFINPLTATENISTAGGTERRNTVTKAQLNGTNPINVLAIPGVVSHNTLMSTRNISEILRFGDLGQKIRRMNRFPEKYGPEYVFSRLEEWPPGSGLFRVELVPNVQNADSRIVILR